MSLSENKRFRLEASGGEQFHHGRTVSTLTFTDLESQRVLWCRPAVDEEQYCHGIFVSDTGRSVLDWGGTLILLAAAGVQTGRLDVLADGFSRAESTRYVHESDGGPIWSGCSLLYFFMVKQQELFVIRPWWGRRIIVDLDTNRSIEESAQLRQTLDSRERAWVLRQLEHGVRFRAVWERQRPRWKEVAPVVVAAYTAGTLRVSEAIPYLRTLEDLPYSATGPLSSWSGYEVRQTCQLSLRRLGQKAIPYPCLVPDIELPEGWSSHAVLDREAQAARVKVGLTAREVLAVLGAPDRISSDCPGVQGGRETIEPGVSSWEYEMDATEQPYTLALCWGEKGVASIRKQFPPLWQSTQWDEDLTLWAPGVSLAD